ncbi:uncharacterized protein LOC120340472 isoform X2 [Styela clava]
MGDESLYEESPYIVVEPLNPNAKNKPIVWMTWAKLTRFMTDFGHKTSKMQVPQVTFRDELNSPSIRNRKTQTVEIENKSDFSCNTTFRDKLNSRSIRNRKTQTVKIESKSDSCNTEIGKEDMEAMVLKLNAMVGKGSRVDLLMQTKEADRRRHMEIFRYEIELVNCHQRNLQIYLRNISREIPSRLLSFASSYADHILDMTSRLTTEDKAKVARQDKVIMAENFKTDPRWRFTNDIPVSVRDPRTKDLACKNTSIKIKKELKKSPSSSRFPEESRNHNSDHESGSKRRRFDMTECEHVESPEMVVLSTADITPENSPPASPRASRKSSISSMVDNISSPVSHSDTLRRRLSLISPVTPPTTPPDEIQNSNYQSDDERSHTPTKPYPANLSSSKTSIKNTSKNRSTSNKYLTNLKLQNRNSYRTSISHRSYDESNTSHAPRKPRGISLRNRHAQRSSRGLGLKSRPRKVPQCQHRPRSRANKQDYPRRERSKSHNSENAEKYDKTPPMLRTVIIRKREEQTSQSDHWLEPPRSHDANYQPVEKLKPLMESYDLRQLQYGAQSPDYYTDNQYLQNRESGMEQLRQMELYYPDRYEEGNDRLAVEWPGYGGFNEY